MLKISESSNSKTRPSEGKVGVSSSRAGRERSKLDGRKLYGNEVESGEVEDEEIGEKVQKSFQSKNSSKSKNLFKSKNLSKSTLDFLTLRAKLAFTKLRQTFFKAPILHHFNPEHHIRIKTDVSGYAIGRVLSQLTSDDLG